VFFMLCVFLGFRTVVWGCGGRRELTDNVSCGELKESRGSGWRGNTPDPSPEKVWEIGMQIS